MRSPLRLVKILVSLTALVVVVGVISSMLTAAGTPPSTQSATCRPILGPFHTHGADVLNSRGRRYVPYGISVVGLTHPVTAATIADDKRQIRATARAWCANTLRLQVSQDQLIDGAGHDPATLTVNRAYFAQVKEEVDYALSRRLIVVITLQTQNDPDFRSVEFMPTRRSLVFWKAMAHSYGRNPQVAFDLFNEPGQVGSWENWRNGFSRNNVRYFGFQELARRVRAFGARNLFWVEGTQHGVQLSQAWKYHLTHVGPLMYSEHRPPQPNTVAVWRKTFGYLAERDLAPVVVGEWAQYARSDAPWACWKNAPVEAPRWLHYLSSIRVGMIAHKLSTGLLVESSRDYTKPTVFKSDWRCENGLDQGAGRLVMRWFHRHNR